MKEKFDICVSVPNRGLFNLTGLFDFSDEYFWNDNFPSPSGDYLI